MIELLWTAAAAALPAAASPAQGDLAMRCRPALAGKVGGEVQDLTVVTIRRTKRWTLVTGEMRALERPAAEPGGLTPHHILNVRYSYTCRLAGGASPRVKVARLNN